MKSCDLLVHLRLHSLLFLELPQHLSEVILLLVLHCLQVFDLTVGIAYLAIEDALKLLVCLLIVPYSLP